MRVTMIAAKLRNGGMGTDKGLPWHCPADLRNFKEVTDGGVLIMSNKTYQTIPNGLPGRHVVTLSHTPPTTPPPDNVTPVQCPVEALAMAKVIAVEKGLVEIFIAGGNEIYRLYKDEINYAVITTIGHHFQTEEPTVFMDDLGFLEEPPWMYIDTVRHVILPKGSIWVNRYQRP